MVEKKVNTQIKKVKESKIHITKYFNISKIIRTDNIKTFLKARFGNAMFTKIEWKSKIDLELKKRIR